MTENVTKAVTATLFATLAAYFHALLFPIVLVLVVMVADYGSGVAVAWKTGELNSRVGIIGIIKKVGYLLLLVVGFAVDWGIWFASDIIGLDFGHIYIFALLVSIWLIMNECISILENVSKMGVSVPPFLLKVIHRLKAAAEKKGDGSSE